MAEVTFTGPLFDGAAPHVIAKMAGDCGQAMAEHAEFVWQMKMDDSFRHPTGAYQSQINIARRDQAFVVNDRGSVYGPWLEGTGSRNAPVTKFKGYASARYTAQAVQRQVPEVCAPIVAKAIAEINHG
jgi:hypothetical protein